MKHQESLTVLCAASIALFLGFAMSNAEAKEQPGYDTLLALFADWREFESPPLLDGAPDYTPAQFAARRDDFLALRERLQSIDTGGWSIPQQVDWHLVRAEMNGYDFNERVLMPWTRDPAFYNTVWLYRSDVPAHEGPTHHALIEVWQYEFPLGSEAARRCPPRGSGRSSVWSRSVLCS